MKTMSQELRERLQAAAVELFEECRQAPPEIRIELPADPQYGDYSSNVAMQLAPVVKDGPLRIASKMKERLGSIPGIESVDVMNPGFINFRVAPSWFAEQPKKILETGKDFGGVDLGKGKRL